MNEQEAFVEVNNFLVTTTFSGVTYAQFAALQRAMVTWKTSLESRNAANNGTVIEESPETEE